MSESLTEFLLARIAEDERAARKLAETDKRPVMSLAITVNHPQRILLECESKRRIVEDFTTLDADYRVTHADATGARRFQALVALAHLALPYADHDDYLPEWRP